MDDSKYHRHCTFDDILLLSLTVMTPSIIKTLFIYAENYVFLAYFLQPESHYSCWRSLTESNRNNCFFVIGLEKIITFVITKNCGKTNIVGRISDEAINKNSGYLILFHWIISAEALYCKITSLATTQEVWKL